MRFDINKQDNIRKVWLSRLVKKDAMKNKREEDFNWSLLIENFE